MTLELNEKERDFLVALLESEHRGKLHELNHTDTADYKSIVREELSLIEALKARLAQS